MDKKELEKYLANENVQYLLYSIYRYESGKTASGDVNLGGFNESAGSSTAFGSGQFIGSTRKEILDKYGVDAWSKDAKEQQLAVIALLHQDDQLKHVAVGTYNERLGQRWDAFNAAKKDDNGDPLIQRLQKTPAPGWQGKFKSLQARAQFDPEHSWSKIDDNIKTEKRGWFSSKYGFDISDSGRIAEKVKNNNEKLASPTVSGDATVPTEEEASKDPRYARTSTPRLNEAKDFINKWRDIQNSERVDKDRALKELANTHPGFKYAVPNYVKGKAKGHSNGLKLDSFDVGYTESNSKLLYHTDLNEIDKWINQSEKAIYKQADAADQIYLGAKPSSVLSGVSKNLTTKLEDPNYIPSVPLNKDDGDVIPFVTDYKSNLIDSEGAESEEEEKVDIPSVIEEQKSAKEIISDYEEFEKWKVDNPDGTYESWKAESTSEVEDSTVGGTTESTGEDVELKEYKESFLDKVGGMSSLIGLASGAIGLGEALKDVDIPKDPKLGPAFQQRLAESKRMAQQGLTPSELAKAHKDLDSAYSKGVENIVRGSAGSRAQFLAGLGGLDVAKQSALMDIAVQDAQMRRENTATYDKMMMFNEKYEAARTAKYNDAKYNQEMAQKEAGAKLAGAGMSMVNDAIADRELNQLRKLQSRKMMEDMGYSFGSEGKESKFDDKGLSKELKDSEDKLNKAFNVRGIAQTAKGFVTGLIGGNNSSLLEPSVDPEFRSFLPQETDNNFWNLDEFEKTKAQINNLQQGSIFNTTDPYLNLK